MKKQLIDSGLVQDKMGENTCMALRGLIDNSHYMQLVSSNIKCDGLSYLKEFCTVRMCGPRRSGHSTAICKIAYEYFDKVAFLSYSYDMAGYLSSTFTNMLKKNSCGDIIQHTIRETITASGYYMFGSQNSLEMFKGREFEAIFVECTFNLSKSKENDIYRTFGPAMGNNPQKLFAFIQ